MCVIQDLSERTDWSWFAGENEASEKKCIEICIIHMIEFSIEICCIGNWRRHGTFAINRQLSVNQRTSIPVDCLDFRWWRKFDFSWGIFWIRPFSASVKCWFQQMLSSQIITKHDLSAQLYVHIIIDCSMEFRTLKNINSALFVIFRFKCSRRSICWMIVSIKTPGPV